MPIGQWLTTGGITVASTASTNNTYYVVNEWNEYNVSTAISTWPRTWLIPYGWARTQPAAEEQAIASGRYEELTRQRDETWGQWITIEYQPAIAMPQRVDPAELVRLEAERRVRLDREVRESAAIKRRAERLLMSMLSADQKAQLEKFRYFDVIGKRSRNRYRVHYGTHGNVRLMEGDREVISYCAQPDSVPTEDAMLAQKLQLEYDEDAFLKAANATDLRSGRRVRVVA